MEQGVEDENEDVEEQDDKGQEASSGSPDSPTILAAYPGELAAEGSEAASIADPSNAESDATLGITDGGGAFQEVRPRIRRRRTGVQGRKSGRGSRQAGRVLEVLRPTTGPATNAGPSSPIRVVTAHRLSTSRSSHWTIVAS